MSLSPTPLPVILRCSAVGRASKDERHHVGFTRHGHFQVRKSAVAKDKPERLKLDLDKVKAWMAKGAKPSDRVMRFLDAAGVAKRETRNNPEKAVPRKERKVMAEEKAKAQEAEKAAAAAKAKEAAAAAPAAS